MNRRALQPIFLLSRYFHRSVSVNPCRGKLGSAYRHYRAKTHLEDNGSRHRSCDEERWNAGTEVLNVLPDLRLPKYFFDQQGEFHGTVQVRRYSCVSQDVRPAVTAVCCTIMHMLLQRWALILKINYKQNQTCQPDKVDSTHRYYPGVVVVGRKKRWSLDVLRY